MNNKAIISFSDSHSFWPFRLGREATVFDVDELSYDNIMKSIRTGNGLKKTIETKPEYGKFHIDGHRACNFNCNYIESKKLGKICPKCKKEMTIGVEYRVEELAKEKEGYRPDNAKDFVEIIPLQELISVVYNIKQLNSRKVWSVYDLLIKQFGNEFNVLLNAPEDELEKAVHEKLTKIIILNREGRLKIKPGADGIYGQILLDDKDKIRMQKSLGEF